MTRYYQIGYKVTCSYTVPEEKLKDMVEQELTNMMEDRGSDDELRVKPLKMTDEEYSALPEFTGY